MPSSDFFSFLTPLSVLALALLIDITLGEPPEKVHPTEWMGRMIIFLEQKMKNNKPWIEKLNGVILGLSLPIIAATLTYLALLTVRQSLGLIIYFIAAAFLLKSTLAIKSMRDFTLPIEKALKQNNLDKARLSLSCIVRRDTSKLDERQIVSAAVESISESTVDGITSPLFYFAVFGTPGAIAFRGINTLDSRVGYMNQKYVNIGWFSARLDTVANYIPARITAILMVFSCLFVGEDSRGAWRILCRDRNRTRSFNAGWPMSATAGALNVQLEKLGHYKLGDDKENLKPEHISRALRIMELTTLLFLIFVDISLIALVTSVIGW